MNDTAVKVKDCNEKHAELIKMYDFDTDFTVIKTFDNQFQVSAYKAKKAHDTYAKVVKLIFKVVSEISVITGAIAVVAEIFL